MSGLWWIQAVLGFAQAAEALLWMRCFFDVRRTAKKGNAAELAFVLASGALTLAWWRYAMYSRAALVCGSLVLGIFSNFLYDGELRYQWAAAILYFEILYSLDLFQMLGSGNAFQSIYHIRFMQRWLTWERAGILAVSRLAIGGVILGLYSFRSRVRVVPVLLGRMSYVLELMAYLALCVSERAMDLDHWTGEIVSYKISTLLFAFVAVGLTLYLLYKQTRQKLQFIELQEKLLLREYERDKKQNEEISRIHHDMKNHLIAMRSLLREERIGELDEYLKKLSEPYTEAAVIRRTGWPVIDQLLAEKEQEAKKKKIAVSIRVELQEGFGTEQDAADWCVLLGNLWDNAIEGAAGLPDARLSFSMRQEGAMLGLRMENSCAEGRGGPRATTKREKALHGFGMWNMEYIAQKYHGDLAWNSGEGRFVVSVYLFPEQKEFAEF